MNEKDALPLSDKQKIVEYATAKGYTKTKFCLTVGWSKGFLDSGASFSVANLKMLIENPLFHDFNLDWFINGEGKMIIDRSEIPQSAFNQQLIFDGMDTISELKEKYGDEKDIQEALKLFKEAFKRLAHLGNDYKVLHDHVASLGDKSK